LVDRDPPVQTHYAHDRLTSICDAMADAFHDHPDILPDDKAIILLSDGDERYGAVFISYDDMTEAMVDLLSHVKATFEANGTKIAIAALPLPEGDEEDGRASPGRTNGDH
jgi:hypothetical protein